MPDRRFIGGETHENYPYYPTDSCGLGLNDCSARLTRPGDRIFTHLWVTLTPTP